MQLDDFRNINGDNIGNLPVPVKLVLLLALFLAVLVVGYYFVLMGQREELENARAKEEDLRAAFLEKQGKAINLIAYKEQMVEIEKTFGALLKQLPNKAEMDGLLSDINRAGQSRGLQFEHFKPGDEIKQEFYAEKPISIKVTGTYHDLGGFATDISKFPRIVTLNDVIISSIPDKDGRSTGILTMEAIAKTYRYLDDKEIAEKKKAEKDAKKGS